VLRQASDIVDDLCDRRFDLVRRITCLSVMNVYIMIILLLGSNHIIRGPICKGFLGFKGLSPGVPNKSIQDTKCPGFFQVKCRSFWYPENGIATHCTTGGGNRFIRTSCR
jgi:hypothetical protein